MSQVLALLAAVGVVALIALIIWAAVAATTDVPSFYSTDEEE